MLRFKFLTTKPPIDVKICSDDTIIFRTSNTKAFDASILKQLESLKKPFETADTDCDTAEINYVLNKDGNEITLSGRECWQVIIALFNKKLLNMSKAEYEKFKLRHVDLTDNKTLSN